MAKINYQSSNNIPTFKNFLGLIVILIIAFILNSKIENLQGGTALSLSLWLGIAFGAVLQRSRFCFYCLSRDFIELKNAKGLLGIVVALVVGTLGYHLIFGAFLIDPVAPRLPPNAHIAPVSWVLVLGSFSFGLGMAIAGSCISAQLYRLGEKSESHSTSASNLVASLLWVQRINHFTNYIINFFIIITFKIS